MFIVEIDNQEIIRIRNLFTIFTITTIIIAIVFLFSTVWILFAPSASNSPLILQNWTLSNNSDLTLLSLKNSSPTGNESTLINEISQFIRSSDISTIIQSNFSEKGIIHLILSNLSLVLMISGAFVAWCAFYYEITYNAHFISEYQASQQRPLKIFFQCLILILILVPAYLFAIYFNYLQVTFMQITLFMAFFILAVFTSAIFSDYTLKIRLSYNNLIQFAALHDSIKILDTLIYFISILGFIFPLLVVLYGINFGFNIFLIIFIIAFILILIWQLNIINNTPRKIYSFKIKDRETNLEGFLLSDLEKDPILILVNEESPNNYIRISQNSIEHSKQIRLITQNEVPNSQLSFSDIISVWDSLNIVRTYLTTIIGFDLGTLLAFIIFMTVAIFTSYTIIPPQLLIVVTLIFAFIFGYYYIQSYLSKTGYPSNELSYNVFSLKTLKNIVVSFNNFVLGFSFGNVVVLSYIVIITDFNNIPPQYLSIISILISLILGLILGKNRYISHTDSLDSESSREK